MIDHTGASVSHLAISQRFYSQALAPLGYVMLMHFDEYKVSGFGEPPKPDFWISEGVPAQPPLHIAFRAASRTVVDAFYQAALAAGGKDNGAPRLRPHYHANYYGAFVLDPDGNNIEAVCHLPE